MTSRNTPGMPVGSVIVCILATLVPVSAQLPARSAETTVWALVAGLDDPTPGVRADAALKLGRMGANAAAAVPALIEAFKDPDPYVRDSVANGLVQIGPVSVPVLAGALTSAHVGVQGGAALVLGRIGPAASAAVPALIGTLRDPDEYVRGNAADALAKIGLPAVPFLRDALRDALHDSQNVDAPGGAAYVLGQIGPEAEAATPALIEALRDSHPYVVSCAADALGRIRLGARVAIPDLTKLLDDHNGEVRSSAAFALGQIGPEAISAAPALVEALKDQHQHVRSSAADALANIGPVCIPVLVGALTHKDGGVRGGAARILGQIGPEAQVAVPHLIAAMKDQYPYVRRQAASALGQIGPEARTGIAALAEALRDQDKDVRVRSASSLGRVAAALTRAQAADVIRDLRSALVAIQSDPDPEVRKHAGEVQARIDEVGPPLSERIEAWAQRYPSVFLAIVALVVYVVLLLCCLVLLGVRPLWLYRINEALKWEVRLLKMPVELTLRYALGVGFFHYHPRVLDAWVAEHIESAREGFAGKAVVEAHSVRVAVPVMLDKDIIPALEANNLQQLFADRRVVCLLIEGEGGSGKTSLACRLAKSAMARAANERICKDHLMLPVFIDQDLEFDAKDSERPFLKAIRAQLRAVTREPTPLPAELVKRLLRRRRALVVIDRLSEMEEASRKEMLDGIADPDVPVNACIVTSRGDERPRNLDWSVVKPQRIKGDRLSRFMTLYLEERSKGDIFTNDGEFFEALKHLSVIVEDREYTVLLAKLFAEYLIAAKDNDAGSDVPENVPDLMLEYVKTIHGRTDTPDILEVQRAAKVVAWQCLKRTYRPAAADRGDVEKAMKDDRADVRLLEYLETRLKLIQTVRAGRDIRFLLDPLSEYLAGLHLVGSYGGDENLWREFLDNADKKEGAPVPIRGFLLAVRDCCLTQDRQRKVPSFVASELAEKAEGGSRTT